MSDAANKRAREVYNTLVKTLREKDWKFQPIDEDMVIRSSVTGEDLPVEFIMRVREDKEIVEFYSKLPCHMPDGKRVDGAIAVCVANYGMIQGCFDYDISDGEIRFRMTNSFHEGTLNGDLMYQMLMIGASTVDAYNDKFFMLAKGMLTVQQFIEQDGAN